jgi:glycosyltransferase involved in cell wall biosynthesis
VKLALVAHGLLPIPPTGWGAVEQTIWQRAQRLRACGHVVDIFNTTYWHAIVDAINEGGYDFVHLHNELFALPFARHLRASWAITTHYGGLTSFRPGGGDRSFEYLFQDILHAPAHIALTNEIADVLRQAGYRGSIVVVENCVEHELFRVIDRPSRPAICLGRVGHRKRQAWLAMAAAQNRLQIDFVGPWVRDEDPDFSPAAGSRWLGEWDRSTLYDQLGAYACMVLLSHSEACTPKAVLEALAAGLSIVASAACAEKLQAEPFVTVVPDDASAEAVIAAVQDAVACNPPLRPQIRAFARDRFGNELGINRYLTAIQEILSASHFSSALGHHG